LTSQFESIMAGVAGHIGNYADVVRIPPGVELIHTSGTPGLRPDGTLPEDFSEEAAQAWRNVEEALARAGATLGDIVSVRQWLTDAADIPAYAAVRSSVITHQPVFMLGVTSAVLTTRKLDRIEALEATRPVHLPTAREESHSRERCCA
jgi:2-iminobutanoate/2-iminopropanoate deaminase